METTPGGTKRRDFQDSQGALCSVQESSVPGLPKLWLGRNQMAVADVDDNVIVLENKEAGNSRMHLNQFMAKNLLKILIEYIDLKSFTHIPGLKEGFGLFDDVDDIEYAINEVEVADVKCIWLGTYESTVHEGETHLTLPDGVKASGKMLLGRTQLVELCHHLLHFTLTGKLS